MWLKSVQKYKLSLMLIVVSFLNSCAPVVCEEQIMPAFPIAGAKVATELETLDFQNYPNLWDWIGRLNKLRLELENEQE